MTGLRALLLVALFGLAACSGDDNSPTLGAPSTIADNGVDNESGDGEGAPDTPDGGEADDGETSTSIEFVPRTDDEDAVPELNLDDFDVTAPTVTDAGAEPRTAMRLAGSEGGTWQPRLSYSTVITQQTGSDPAGSVFSLPATEVDLTVTATDVKRDGTHITEFSYDRFLAIDDGTAEGNLVADAQTAYDGLIGPGGELVLAGNGQLLTSQQLVAAEILPFMADALADFDKRTDLMFVPMPAEPVGVGAVWELITAKDVIGTMVETVARYELVELSGDSYRVTITTSERQAGADGGLTNSTVTGNGEASGSLGSIGPSAVVLTTNGSQSFDGDITRTVDKRFALQAG